MSGDWNYFSCQTSVGRTVYYVAMINDVISIDSTTYLSWKDHFPYMAMASIYLIDTNDLFIALCCIVLFDFRSN